MLQINNIAKLVLMFIIIEKLNIMIKGILKI